jgi:hypothetical protein
LLVTLLYENKTFPYPAYLNPNLIGFFIVFKYFVAMCVKLLRSAGQLS